MIHAIRQKILIPNSTLLRIAVLAGLAVMLLGIGFVTPRVPPELVLIAVAAPPVVLLALNRLEYGVLALLLTAAFVRASLPTGTQSRIVASLLLTAALSGIWLGRMLVVEKRLHLKPTRTNVPVMGIIAVSIASYLWGNAFRDPLVMVWRTWPAVQLGALGVMVLLPCAFLLTVNCITETRWLKALYWIMVAIGAMSMILDFANLPGRFINVGGLFSLWFVSLTYGQVLFNKKLPSAVRLGLALLLCGWLYRKFIVEVYWFSGWLPSLMAMGVITLLRSRKALVVLLLIMIVYLGLNWNYYSTFVLARESEESGVTRLAAWEMNWQVTSRHLLLGTGPAGYAAYYMSYFPTRAMATHSNYIDILSQLGVVGLAFYLWFLAALIVTGMKLRNRVKGEGDFVEGLAAGTLGGCIGLIVAMGLGDWVIPFVYTQTIAGFDYALYGWMWLGAMVSLAHVRERRD